jgi:hypothetical protein
MTYTVPFSYTWKASSVAAAGLFSQVVTLNNGFGRFCKRILYAPFNATGNESLTAAYDHQNLNGSKVISYQTLLDSIPRQDYYLSTLQPTAGANNMDDWRENRPLMRGTAVEHSLPYYANWLHIDSWSQPKRDKVLIPTSNILEGLDLGRDVSPQGHQWTLNANVSGSTALNHYFFGTFVREIIAGPMGTLVKMD